MLQNLRFVKQPSLADFGGDGFQGSVLAFDQFGKDL
jgi:hypothetical protein